MKVKLYLSDWFYNAGIIGFLRVLENAEDKFAIKKENYIEFDTENLRNFHIYYFKYFMDKYDIAKKMEERINKSYRVLESYIKLETKTKEEEKKKQEKIKIEKKHIKQSLKTQMDKIKKYDEETYEQMLEKYNQIDKIKETEELEEIFDILKQCLYKENINTKLTMNLFKSILSKSYFGQPSFLNVVKSATPFEEQREIMYKDYISNIIESGFLQNIIEDKYDIEEIEKYINSQKENGLLSKEVEKIYENIDKNFVKKQRTIEDIKKYIKERAFSNCYMCENENTITGQYSESNFIPLAISSDNMKNFFWNQNAEFPICDMCKLILFCIPAGITSITKTVKENENGKQVYKEKELYSFVNYDTSVDMLYKTNNNFGARSKIDKTIDNPYQELIVNIVNQDKKISSWQLQNIFVVEFETEYLAYSRMEYFNIKKYVANFFVKYADKSLNIISDYRYKLQMVDYILKNKDIKYIINDRIRDCMTKGVSAHNSLFATIVRQNINLLKKEEKDMQELIDKNNKKLYALYNLGIEIHEKLKHKNEVNKLNGYTYKMLNSIKTNNKKEFMDIVIRLHMAMGQDVPSIFLEVMQESNLDFESIGHSFISGLISNKYEKENKEVEVNG